MFEERFVDSAIRKALGHKAPGDASPCPDENLLAAYIERSLSDLERRSLESHVAACTSCQNVLALSMRMAGDEQAATEEPRVSPQRTVLFRLSVPLASAAALVLGIGITIVSLLTHEVRKVERTDIAQQRPPAAAPVAGNLPAPPKELATTSSELAKPSVPSSAPEQFAKARIADDEMGRAKDKKAMVLGEMAPPAGIDSRRRGQVPSPSEPVAMSQVAGAASELKGVRPADALATRAERESAEGRVVGAPVGGVVGGGAGPARSLEELAARAPETQVASIKADSDRAKGESVNQEARLAAKKERAAFAAVSTTESGTAVRDILHRMAVDRKSDGRRDRATRAIDGRTFQFYEGYWIDLKCLENPDAELVERGPGSPERDEISKTIPGLEELRSSGSPVLIEWKGGIFVVR